MADKDFEEMVDRTMVRNIEQERIPSNMNLEQFAKAMSQLDLENIPADRKEQAVMDHLMRIMEQEVNDKSLAKEIKYSRMMHAMEGQ